MTLYCGTHPRATNSVIAVLDDQGRAHFEDRLSNDLGLIIEALSPVDSRGRTWAFVTFPLGGSARADWEGRRREAEPPSQLSPSSTITSQDPTKPLATSPEPKARASQQFFAL